ncbi:flagellar motor switch protein FliG [bacterium]|nr:flagellar motor switch protein FliG [bacterium]
MEATTGTNKAVTLLLTLGVDCAIAVTRELDRAVAYDLMRLCANVKEINPADSQAILEEFLEKLQYSAQPTGREFVSQVMQEAFGGDQDPLTSIEFLRRLDKSQLLEIVQNEHPQVAAFVLSYVQPEQAASLLCELSPEQQMEVATRIATSEPPRREVLSHLARTLGARWNSFFSSEGLAVEAGGLDALVRIMKGVGREVEQNILFGFLETQPELAEELKKNMFVFDDLAGLEDRSIQKLLKEVDGKVLALALKRANAETLEVISRNLSERARNILKEDLEAAGKVKLKDVDRAQSDVVAVVRRLEEAGEITLGNEDDAYV